MANALINCKPEFKKRVLQLYMARQNFMHTVRFLQWTANNKESPDEELLETIQSRLQQMFEVDQILFSGVEIPKFSTAANFK